MQIGNAKIREVWAKVRPYVLNKYFIVIVFFAAVFIFGEEQGAISKWKRSKQIKETQRQIERIQKSIQQAELDMEVLQHSDSLERYAREKYYMHAANEEVYVVKDK